MSEVEVTIGGLAIKCPFKPYSCQISIMHHMLRGLRKGQNCLLESPTGSGKSLAILCAALAWQQEVKELQRTQRLSPTSGSVSCSKDEDNKDGLDTSICKPAATTSNTVEPIPKIFLCSRTHKQISQLVGELRKTSYANVAMTILSAREHTCINPEVVASDNINEGCTSLLKLGSGCRYRHKLNNETTSGIEDALRNVINMKKEKLLLSSSSDAGAVPDSAWDGKTTTASDRQPKQSGIAWDVDDMVKAGRRCGFCPYFASTKRMFEVAELILCPYNYLIDPLIRDALNLKLEKSVVIVDEGHNIEDVCMNAATFTFSLEQLILAATDFKRIAELKIKASANNELRALMARMAMWLRQVYQTGAFVSADRNPTLKILNLSQSDMLDVIRQFKISKEDIKTFWGYIAEVSRTTDDDRSDDEQDKSMADIEDGFTMSTSRSSAPGMQNSDLPHPGFTSIAVVEMYLHFLQYVLQPGKDGGTNRLSDYKTCVCTDLTAASDGGFPVGKLAVWTSKNENNMPKVRDQDIVLHLVCLNPAIAFEDVSERCRSTVITSGTLAPLGSFEAELQTSFAHKLEARHVIKPERMLNVVVTRGPTGKQFCLNAAALNDPSMQDEIGVAIVEVCRVVPGGVLCFFPSYKALNSIMRRWDRTGLSEKLNEVKHIVSEPKRNSDLQATMREYYGAIAKPKLYGKGCIGAVFFAVCRGKVSEGLDFANERARAVIAVGIPYPNLGSMEINAKRAYNNERAVRASKTGAAYISGDRWYETQAFRAVNQALGRCMRHANDWAALILLDERWTMPKKQQGLSRWIRDTVVPRDHFANMINELGSFAQRLHAEYLDQQLQAAISAQNKGREDTPDLDSKAERKRDEEVNRLSNESDNVKERGDNLDSASKADRSPSDKEVNTLSNECGHDTKIRSLNDSTALAESSHTATANDDSDLNPTVSSGDPKPCNLSSSSRSKSNSTGDGDTGVIDLTDDDPAVDDVDPVASNTCSDDRILTAGSIWRQRKAGNYENLIKPADDVFSKTIYSADGDAVSTSGFSNSKSSGTKRPHIDVEIDAKRRNTGHCLD